MISKTRRRHVTSGYVTKLFYIFLRGTMHFSIIAFSPLFLFISIFDTLPSFVFNNERSFFFFVTFLEEKKLLLKIDTNYFIDYNFFLL